MRAATIDTRQGDLFALFAAPSSASPLADLAQLGAKHRAMLSAAPAPKAERQPLPKTGADLLGQANACCATCEATGPAERFQHTEAHGLECLACIGARNASCIDCGKSFTDPHGRAERQFIRPDGSGVCWCCNEWRAMNKPQADLTSDEATDAVRAYFATLPWIDAQHRNRATWRLRGGFESAARMCNADASKAAKAKARAAARVDVERVERVFRITRHRPIADLAADMWPLIHANDRNHRNGKGHDPQLWQQVDDLLAEANGGTTCGIRGWRRDHPGPHRLWAAVKWRARCEGRLPMFGLPGVIRFQCRGMHIVASMARGGSYSSDGFHLDRDRHRPGDPSFSSTGYRSMRMTGGRDGDTPQDAARRTLEAFIDAPVKDGQGLGGKLERWVPFHAEPWRDLQLLAVRRPEEASAKYRSECPAMVPAEDRPAYWQRIDRERREKADQALAWMQARGVDPYKLFPEVPRQSALL